MAKGVSHYTRSGKLHSGEMHKMKDGTLHTGKSHTKSSVQLFHLGELSKSVQKRIKQKGMNLE